MTGILNSLLAIPGVGLSLVGFGALGALVGIMALARPQTISQAAPLRLPPPARDDAAA